MNLIILIPDKNDVYRSLSKRKIARVSFRIFWIGAQPNHQDILKATSDGQGHQSKAPRRQGINSNEAHHLGHTHTHTHIVSRRTRHNTQIPCQVLQFRESSNATNRAFGTLSAVPPTPGSPPPAADTICTLLMLVRGPTGQC